MRITGSAGRTSLSRKEYLAYRQLAGVLNTLITEEDNLRKRAVLVKHGWRDLRMVRAVLTKLYRAIWHTIPEAEQKKINQELNHMVTYVDVKRPQDNGDDPAMTYVSMKVLCRLADRVMRQECLWCDKCGKKVHTCQLRKDLEATYKWNIDRLPDGTCPFAGLVETGRKKK